MGTESRQWFLLFRYKAGTGKETTGKHAVLQFGASPSSPSTAWEGECGVPKQTPNPTVCPDEIAWVEQDHSTASRSVECFNLSFWSFNMLILMNCCPVIVVVVVVVVVVVSNFFISFFKAMIRIEQLATAQYGIVCWSPKSIMMK